jgi:predicted CxxxxCH...CXXCH cytochrome family protein
VGFGAAGGAPGSSCNDCHSGGTTAWQTNCTFCHGTPGRTGEQAGTDPLLSAAPPVGTQGEAAATEVAVGAHQAHVNPAASGAVTTPIACAVCHPSPLPTDLTHVDGQPAAVAFSGLAVTGGITTAAYASGSCSATYCHGNFAGGANATPSWTAGATTCTSCHGNPPNSGRHAPRESSHSFGCNFCHGTGYTSTAVVVATHVDGAKTMGAGTLPGWNPTTRNCTNACHPGGEGPW